MNTTSTRPPYPTCEHIEVAPYTDFYCDLPAGHAGDHTYLDAMGA